MDLDLTYATWAPAAVDAGRTAGGIRVVAVPMPGQPVAAVEVTVASGAELEPVDGVAVVLTSLLAEGTASRDPDTFLTDLELLGATLRPVPSLAGPRLHLRCPTASLPAALALVAESLATPRVTAADVARVVGIRTAEVAAEDASAETRAHLANRRLLFAPSSRYARRLGGDRASLARIDPAVVTAFAGAHLAADRTTVTVAGDLTSDAALAIVDAALAGWDVTRGAAPDAPAPVTRTGPRVLLVDRPGSVQSYVVLGRPGIDRRHPDWTALRLGTHVLGGSLTARLDTVLREEKGYTYGFRAAQQPYRRGGLWLARGAVDAAVTAPAIAEALAQVEFMAADGPTASEVSRAAAYLAGSTPVRLQTAAAAATDIGTLVAAGLPVTWLAGHLEDLVRTPVTAVADALATHLDDLRVVVVGDAESVLSPLAALGLGDVAVES